MSVVLAAVSFRHFHVLILILRKDLPLILLIVVISRGNTGGRRGQQITTIAIFQSEIESGIACVFYIEQLVRHAQPELKEKRPKKRLLENLRPLISVVTDLEVDLRANPNESWVPASLQNCPYLTG